jgi:hypothetical protein
VDGETDIQFLSGPSAFVFSGCIPSKLIEGHCVAPGYAVADLLEKTVENIAILDQILLATHILTKGIAHAGRNPLHH